MLPHYFLQHYKYVFLNFFQTNLEESNFVHKRCCHNLFNSKWGLVFWHLTSKYLDSFSCRHWRKVKRMPNAKSVTEVKATSQDDRGVGRFIVSAESQCHLPWNTVLSISFVFSIQHDQLSFLFSCSFIWYLMEGLSTWKTWPLCLSSQWHHPSGCTWELILLKWNSVY